MKPWQKELLDLGPRGMFPEDEWEHIVLNELEENSFAGPSIFHNDFYKELMMEYYGVENPMHHPEIVDKFKTNYRKACMEKYGVPNTSMVPAVKAKIAKSVGKYQRENPSCGRGEDNICHRPEVKAKHKYNVNLPIIEQLREKRDSGAKLPAGWILFGREKLEKLLESLS